MGLAGCPDVFSFWLQEVEAIAARPVRMNSLFVFMYSALIYVVLIDFA